MNVVPLIDISPEDQAHLDDIVTKLNTRYTAKDIRALCVLTVTKNGEWFQAHFNSTFSEESYMIQLIQARLLKAMNERLP